MLKRPLRTVWILVTILVPLAFLWQNSKEPGSGEPLTDLLIQDGNRRWMGRLSGEKAFRPYLPRSNGASVFSEDEPSPELARQAARYCRKLPTSEQARCSATILYLRSQRWDRAIALLRSALYEDPDSPELLNDLSVAYLERGSRNQRPLDVLTAIQLSSDALDRRPDFAEAKYTLAAILSRLYLRETAAAQWRLFLDDEPDGLWAAAARHYLDYCTQELYLERWEVIQANLIDSASPKGALVQEAALQYPKLVRELAEENLLGSWARAVLTSDEPSADKFLNLVSTIGEALAKNRSDFLLLDATAILRSPSDQTARQHLARAHGRFTDGMAMYHSQKFDSAEKVLAEAEMLFAKSGSIYRQVANLYRAICLYYRDTHRSQVDFRKALDHLDRARYPGLAGRLLWMKGTTFLVRNQLQAAIDDFEEMRPLLDQAEGKDQAAAADLLLGEAYAQRGDLSRSWNHRWSALSILTFAGNPRRRHSILEEAAKALEKGNQLKGALYFVEETSANATKWGNDVPLVETLIRRSRIQSRLQKFGEALRDADEALTVAARIEDQGLQRRFEAQAQLSRALALENDAAADALSAARLAQKGFDAIGWEHETQIRNQIEASVLLATGREGEAGRLLEEAVLQSTKLRREAKDLSSRISVFQQAADATRRLLEFQWKTKPSDLPGLVETAERSRSDLFAHNFASSQQPTRELLKSIAVLLPSRYHVIGFTSLEECLVSWSISGGTVRYRILSLRSNELANFVAQFRLALHANNVEKSQLVGSTLYDRLIRPLELELGPDDAVVVVPDGPLGGLPFAALYDGQARKWQVERATWSFVPSADLLLTLLKRRRSFDVEHLNTLIVGAPTLSPDRSRDFAILADAEHEGEMVARCFTNSVLLSGLAASRSAILRGLRGVDLFHFAGHAVQTGPELEDTFLLTASPGRREPDELSIRDILELQGRSPNLVVLASCRSLSSYAADLEGVTSLAGGFLSAGSLNVIAPYWEVSDRPTSALMEDFYRALKGGESPTSALRTATIRALSATSDDARVADLSPWSAFAALGL